jgi:hypothetical protein
MSGRVDTLGARRDREHLGGTLGARSSELLAHLYRHDTDTLGGAEVGVPDRAVAAADRTHDTGGAVGGLAALDVGRPDAVGLELPAADGFQVLREVLGGAGVVLAVHRRDRQVGKVHAFVVSSDRVVVPLG